MNLLPEKKYRVPSWIFVKKMFCAKKVTKLPDLTVIFTYYDVLDLISRYLQILKHFAQKNIEEFDSLSIKISSHCLPKCILWWSLSYTYSWSRIHERTILTILWRFLGIVPRVVVYNAYITNQFQTTFAVRGVNPLAEVTVNSKDEKSYNFCPNYDQEFGLCLGTV
jgi:hypothetical protein